MTAITFHQALSILTWFLITVLLVFLLLIARFYQKMTGERTYFWSFGAPIVLFGVAAARDAFNDRVGGDGVSNVMWFAGGVMLAGMCIYLYNLMTANRRGDRRE